MIIFFLCFYISSIAQEVESEYYFESILFESERWWGGVVVDGSIMPFGKYEYEHDLYGDVKENQGSPV